MFCPNCGEQYNYFEPRCPWCGAPKPHKEVSSKEPVEIEEKLPFKTRLYSKRYVAALILFIIGITCLTVITRDAFIAEYPDIINFNSTYFVAFVFFNMHSLFRGLGIYVILLSGTIQVRIPLYKRTKLQGSSPFCNIHFSTCIFICLGATGQYSRDAPPNLHAQDTSRPVPPGNRARAAPANSRNAAPCPAYP